MIRKEKHDNEYKYYDGDVLLFKIDIFDHHILLKQALNYINGEYEIIYLDKDDCYRSLISNNLNIIYKFESFIIKIINTDVYLLDTNNYDVIITTNFNNYIYYTIKYALKKLRKEKLKYLL